MPTLMETVMSIWEEECMRWRGRKLTGKFQHYCHDWDGLPVDETTEEFLACTCYDGRSDNHSIIAVHTRYKLRKENGTAGRESIRQAGEDGQAVLVWVDEEAACSDDKATQEGDKNVS